MRNRAYYILCGLCIAVIATSVTEISITPSGRASAPQPPTVEQVERVEPEIVDTAELVDTETIPDPLDKYSVDDIQLMAEIVRAESGNQDIKGKRLVAAVILNRIESDEFPDTVHDVVYQKNQFATVTDGALEKAERTVNGEDYRAVEMEIRERTDTTILYFTAGNYNSCGTPAYRYGAHYFSNF